MSRKLWILLCFLLTSQACNLPEATQDTTEPAPATNTPAVTQPITFPPTPADVVATADFEYSGTFRLPGGEDPPRTFAYGGNAMTFNPDGARVMHKMASPAHYSSRDMTASPMEASLMVTRWQN